MLSRRLLFASLLPVLGVFVAYADDAPEKPPAVFESLFPVPSGTNGFEEVVRAGERLREAKAAQPRASEFTLTKKRLFLADPACQDALTMLRQGLAKPITIPTQDLSNSATISPFALLRALARLLAVEIYVCFADGRNDAAIVTVDQVLKLTYSMKSINTVWGLVAGAMDSTVLTALLQKRDGWRVRDCQRVQQIAQKWLAQPNPAIASLSVERDLALKMVADYREQWDNLAEQLEYHYATEEDEPDTPESLQAEEYAKSLRTDPVLRARVLGEMASLINAHFDRAYALMNNPTGRMTLDIPPATSANWHPITLALQGVVLLDAGMIIQRDVENQLQLQLLLLHAAIRRYRWENDRLPKTLVELKLPTNTIVDPFTAKPLLYEPEPTGTKYRLASAGALTPGEEGKPDTRESFALPREIRKP